MVINESYSSIVSNKWFFFLSWYHYVVLLPLYTPEGTIKLKFQCFVDPRIISFCDKEFENLDFHYHFCLPSPSLLSLHFVLSALLTFRLLWCAVFFDCSPSGVYYICVISFSNRFLFILSCINYKYILCFKYLHKIY